MKKSVFKRKIYDEILEWKKNKSDKYALMIKGARRIGKSTIAEEFAKREFKSYILIDFAHTSKAIKDLFDDTYDLDFFFLQLQQLTGTRLYDKESVIIFDEVQLLPKARQAIKYLVADGRYKYIETGSLISIKKNTKDILIPSEEHKISMYPMDFEEFLWAIGDEITAETIKTLLTKRKPAGKKKDHGRAAQGVSEETADGAGFFAERDSTPERNTGRSGCGGERCKKRRESQHRPFGDRSAEH